MFNGDDAVIARLAQLAENSAPGVLAVAVTHGAENPRALVDAVEGRGVQDAVDRRVVGVDGGVLGMEVVDGALEGPDGGDDVDALPEEVGGVEVRADDGADGLAQAKQRGGVVDAEAGVELKGNLVYAVLLRKFGFLFPIGNELLVPLPVADLLEIRRPAGDGPVWVLGIFAVARAAGEADNGFDADFFRQADCGLKLLVVSVGNLFVGVDGISNVL